MPKLKPRVELEPTLRPFLCRYFTSDDNILRRWRCEAEDLLHAEEQLRNAEPKAQHYFIIEETEG